MSILNYTTKIPVECTVGEIQSTLAKAGAQSVKVAYADGEPDAIFFDIDISGNTIEFRLPSRWRGVQQVGN